MSVSKWEYTEHLPVFTQILVKTLATDNWQLLKIAQAKKKEKKEFRHPQRTRKTSVTLVKFSQLYVHLSVKTGFLCFKVHSGEYGCPILLNCTTSKHLQNSMYYFLACSQFTREKKRLPQPIPSYVKCWSLQVKTNLAAGKQPLQIRVGNDLNMSTISCLVQNQPFCFLKYKSTTFEFEFRPIVLEEDYEPKQIYFVVISPSRRKHERKAFQSTTPVISFLK